MSTKNRFTMFFRLVNFFRELFILDTSLIFHSVSFQHAQCNLLFQFLFDRQFSEAIHECVSNKNSANIFKLRIFSYLSHKDHDYNDRNFNAESH